MDFYCQKIESYLYNLYRKRENMHQPSFRIIWSFEIFFLFFNTKEILLCYCCKTKHFLILNKKINATCRWFSPSTPVFSNNKTDSQDITERLLKVVLNTIILNRIPIKAASKSVYQYNFQQIFILLLFIQRPYNNNSANMYLILNKRYWQSF